MNTWRMIPHTYMIRQTTIPQAADAIARAGRKYRSAPYDIIRKSNPW